MNLMINELMNESDTNAGLCSSDMEADVFHLYKLLCHFIIYFLWKLLAVSVVKSALLDVEV